MEGKVLKSAEKIKSQGSKRKEATETDDRKEPCKRTMEMQIAMEERRHLLRGCCEETRLIARRIGLSIGRGGILLLKTGPLRYR